MDTKFQLIIEYFPINCVIKLICVSTLAYCIFIEIVLSPSVLTLKKVVAHSVLKV